MTQEQKTVCVLVAGLGNLGRCHALAYHHDPGFEIFALVNQSTPDPPDELKDYPFEHSFPDALERLKPDLASISTYSDTHANYVIAAMEAGADVFVEIPIATTVADAKRIVARANEAGRKLVVCYIMRHHPSWITLIEKARELGGPYVFRLGLNKQSSGPTWETHESLMNTMPPIVDCGVHYVDVMCQITDGKPVKVPGMGLRQSDEIAPDMYNYGHFQVTFDDGSVGWYEPGRGPMISETAFFVNDIISPTGSVSIVIPKSAKSDDVDTHTKSSLLRIHRAGTDSEGNFLQPDTDLSMEDEPGHDDLCAGEQAYMLKAIRKDIDLTCHMSDAEQSRRICLAADESVRSGREIHL